MSDADVVRLVPLYQNIKLMLKSVTGHPGVYGSASELVELVERAILTDGMVNKVMAGIAANDLLIAAQYLAEQAEAIKARLAEVTA